MVVSRRLLRHTFPRSVGGGVVPPSPESRSRVYGGASSEQFQDVFVDGDYIYAVGTTSSEGVAPEDCLIVKFNKSDLSIAARKVYGGADGEWFEGVFVDGDYVYAVGWTYSAGLNGAALIVKFNKSDLSIVAQKIYSGATDYEDFVDIFVAGDYVYAVGGTYSEGQGSEDCLIVKFDKNDLTIAARKVYGGAADDWFEGVFVDGNYVYVTGATVVGGRLDGLIVKFNAADLSIAAAKVYGGGGNDEFQQGGIYVDSSFVYATGYTRSAGEGGFDCLIVQFNKTDLSIATQKIYGGSGDEIFYGVFVDNSYVWVVGATTSEGEGDYDCLIVKFNVADLSIAAAKIYGGAGQDWLQGIFIDGYYIYVVGLGSGFRDCLIIRATTGEIPNGSSVPAGFVCANSALVLADPGFPEDDAVLTLNDSSLTLSDVDLTIADSALTLSDPYVIS